MFKEMRGEHDYMLDCWFHEPTTSQKSENCDGECVVSIKNGGESHQKLQQMICLLSRIRMQSFNEGKQWGRATDQVVIRAILIYHGSIKK